MCETQYSLLDPRVISEALDQHAIVSIADVSGNMVYANDKFCQISKYSRDELIGQNHRLLKSGLHDAKFFDDMWLTISNGRTWQGEVCNRSKDGGLYWVETTIVPSLDENGLPYQYVSIRTEVTQIKQVEASLARSNAELDMRVNERTTELHHLTGVLYENEQRFRQLAENIHEVFWMTDPAKDKMLYISPAYESIWGRTMQSLYDSPQSWSEAIHGEDRQRVFQAAMTKQVAGLYDEEYRIIRSNGDIRWIHDKAFPVRDSKGTVYRLVGVAEDITERKAAEEAIKNLAYYDTLTHLPNRRFLMDRLNQALAACRRNSRQSALLLIDMDNFKTLNDSVGHDIGDLLLKKVAQRLESCIREGDTVARLGGDEFVVILENLSEQPNEAAVQTETVGEKILAAFTQPYLLVTHEYHGSASIGVALFDGQQSSIDELMKQADIAMYQAKKAGRNTLRFFDQQMQDIVTVRVALEGELRKALENRQFHLHYQIQMDNAHRPLGAEALIRWIHPERGMVLPEQFIPLAEETGLILPIGQWVLDTACAQLKAWQQDALTCNLVLAINISAKQFRQADFATQVQAAMQRHAINPMRLKLELTESLLLEDIEDAVFTMSALNEINVQLSLDDFGTGYSSLQYLKQLPLDQLKIDQSFVYDIATDSRDKAVVHAIIAMAHSLGMDVLAEGVETEDQRQLLLSMGCTNYQGYLFGRPMPIEQFEASLKQDQAQTISATKRISA
jgi:diguanylate cyclase (GGDEF)-like protein/PAS domain S-box-containing protein